MFTNNEKYWITISFSKWLVANKVNLFNMFIDNVNRRKQRLIETCTDKILLLRIKGSSFVSETNVISCLWFNILLSIFYKKLDKSILTIPNIKNEKKIKFKILISNRVWVPLNRFFFCIYSIKYFPLILIRHFYRSNNTMKIIMMIRLHNQKITKVQHYVTLRNFQYWFYLTCRSLH